MQSGMASASLSIKPKKVSRKGVPRGRRKVSKLLKMCNFIACSSIALQI